LEQAGRPLQRWKATFLASSNSRDPLSHFVVVEFTTIGLMDHLHTSWMTPIFRADFLHSTSKSVEVSPNLPPDDKNARARGAQAIYLQHF
jgi:hypothetical protein